MVLKRAEETIMEGQLWGTTGKTLYVKNDERSNKVVNGLWSGGTS